MSRSTHLTSSHSSSGHRPHKALAALLRTVSPVLPRDVARIGRRRVRCNIRLPKAQIHNYLQGRHIDTRSIDIRQCLYVVGQGGPGVVVPRGVELWDCAYDRQALPEPSTRAPTSPLSLWTPRLGRRRLQAELTGKLGGSFRSQHVTPVRPTYGAPISATRRSSLHLDDVSALSGGRHGAHAEVDHVLGRSGGPRATILRHHLLIGT